MRKIGVIGLVLIILLPVILAGCIPSEAGYVNIMSMPEGWLSANVSMNGSIIIPTPTFSVNLATPTIIVPTATVEITMPTPTITVPVATVSVSVNATGATGQGFTWRGAWQSGNNYNAYDVCTDLGYCYTCISSFTNSTTHPASDGAHFSEMASKGDTTAGAVMSVVLIKTRDAGSAAGDVSYTGAGFQPTCIIVMGSWSTVACSWGYCSQAIIQGCQYLNYAGAWATSSTYVVLMATAAATYQRALVKSFDADGFTLTWSKAGAPAGTITMTILCLK